MISVIKFWGLHLWPKLGLVQKFYFGLILANFKPTVVGPRTNIGCLNYFSVDCVKFMLLCSSPGKTFAKINFFNFFGLIQP